MDWLCEAQLILFLAVNWEAMQLRLSVDELLILSLAVLVVAPPTSPTMPGIYQGVVITCHSSGLTDHRNN